jgi:hypothetical protein
VSAPPLRAQHYRRRLAGRTLPSLLRYKFLHEYGYDKGAVVVAAIVEDICNVVRNYFRRPDDLEPGQLIYLCPAADEHQQKGKTMANTRLVPVRLTVVAEEDIEAITAGSGAVVRRGVRVRPLVHDADAQGGVLPELDLSLVTGYTDGAVSATVMRLRKRGEILPIRGYVADIGSWPPNTRVTNSRCCARCHRTWSPSTSPAWMSITSGVYRRRRVRRA